MSVYPYYDPEIKSAFTCLMPVFIKNILFVVGMRIKKTMNKHGRLIKKRCNFM